MKFIDVEKRNSPMKLNLIALVFVIIAIAGVFLSVGDKKDVKRIEKLQEIAADTTIKNIDVTYKPSDPGKFQKQKSMAGTSQYMQSFYRTMITVSILFVLFFLVVYLMKKKEKPGSGNGDIKIVDRKYLGQKQYLLTVMIENEKLLLGVTDHSINLIKKLGNTSDIAEETIRDSVADDDKDSFPKILGKLRRNTNEN